MVLRHLALIHTQLSVRLIFNRPLLFDAPNLATEDEVDALDRLALTVQVLVPIFFIATVRIRVIEELKGVFELELCYSLE